jgi:ATP-dependent helicase/nuclease subunit B
MDLTYKGEIPAKLDQRVLDAMRRGETVLTASQRAARALQRSFDKAMRAEGRQQWAPARVLALDTWMAAMWREMVVAGDESRVLLNRSQEHTIWRSILSADREVLGLRSSDSLAELAARAWSLTCLHSGLGRLREFGVSTDTKAFQRWAQEFERRCTRSLYLSAAQLPTALGAALAEGRLPVLNSGLMIVDFDSLTPGTAGLLEAIELAGFPVERIDTRAPSTGWLCVGEDEASELRQAARWIGRRLDEAPGVSIAVVVPAMEERRGEIERVFSEILEPEAQAIHAPARAPLFEFSLGLPLAATALGAAALQILRWAMEALPLESVSMLLRSRYFGGAGAEALATAELDAYALRAVPSLRPEIGLAQMGKLLSNPKSGAGLDGLRRRMRGMETVARDERLVQPGVRELERRGHAEWSDAFRKLLEAGGFGEALENESEATQARRRWESTLDELATLDFDGSRVTAADALGALTRIARETIFAPKSTNAPVQIMGPLEPGGAPFDALWFLGADDLSWPVAVASHPLIPWNVQRALGMPGADAARDNEAARRLTERIAGSAADVVFSYAQRGEEGVRRASPLLAGLDLIRYEGHGAIDGHTAVEFEEYIDTEPIAALPEGPVHGGATILQLQAACAFRAFAEKRLQSTEPEAKEPGLDARERGNIVHKVMQSFWTTTRDQMTLRAMPDTARLALLEECIDGALEKAQELSKSAWDTAYLRVQRTRLRRLLEPWLEVEMARPAFAVREQEKEKKNAHIGPLQLDLRADRIDDTEGGALILDYKTGGAAPSEWLTDRPDAPQLPLYAVLAGEPIAGVAFALLRAGDGLSLKGFADDATALAKPSAMRLGMVEQVEEWRRILTRLATEFTQGDAEVAPKHYPKTCKHCAQRILCRLDVTSLDEPEDDDEPSHTGSDLA